MLGVNPRFDFIASVPADVADPDAPGRVHLVAIGGAGMSAVARLLLERGVAVSGSDAKDSPALADLAERGAEVHVGHDPAHVAGAGCQRPGRRGLVALRRLRRRCPERHRRAQAGRKHSNRRPRWLRRTGTVRTRQSPRVP